MTLVLVVVFLPLEINMPSKVKPCSCINSSNNIPLLSFPITVHRIDSAPNSFKFKEREKVYVEYNIKDALLREEKIRKESKEYE